MRQLMVGVGLATTIACSNSTPSPTRPSTTTSPTTAPSVVTPATSFSGTLIATNGGQPLAGVSVSTGGTTDTSGHFTSPPSATTLTFSGSSILTRVVNLQQPGHAFTADAIVLTANTGFDLTFYREFVRNGYEAPNQLQPVRHLTTSPKIYMRTVDQNGVAIDTASLSSTATTLRDAIGAWTAGKLSVASITQGTGTMEGVSGWLTVKWTSSLVGSAGVVECGRATVGVDGGYIELDPHPNFAGCRCPPGLSTIAVAPDIVKHELGHAVGYWHTDNALDLMTPFRNSVCDKQPSERELYHARIAYSRPNGNLDPDTDPAGVGLLDVRSYSAIIND